MRLRSAAGFTGGENILKALSGGAVRAVPRRAAPVLKPEIQLINI